MDFTRPFQQNATDRQLSATEMLRALRLDLAAELDAMSLYAAHIESISDPHVQAVLASIRDDEKEHAAQLIRLLTILDETQDGTLQLATANLASPAHPIPHYPSIAERVRELDQRVNEFEQRMTR